MSSATSNRYQSRLFNFVYKRSRRLTEQLNRAMQSVASWIMPVVSYPAQVLHARVNKSLPQLPELDKSDLPPNADTPVKNVLSLVESQADDELAHPSQPPTPTNFLAWLGGRFFPKTQTISIRSSAQPAVQGIASYISNRALVLVTPQNEILDILDSWQQQKLQARIIDEVAQYWRYQRLLVGVNATTEQPPGKQLLPVRLFSNITAWLQVGELSKSSDRTCPDSYDERGELIFATQQAIAFLDRSIAQFEANHLAAPRENPAKTNKLPIQALIWAAVDYFFGDRQGKKIQPNQLKKNPNLPTTKQRNFLTASEDKITDPWLTLEDLFGVSKSAKQPALVSNEPSFKITQLPEDSTLKRSTQLLNTHSLRSLFKRIQSNKSSSQIAQSQPLTRLAKVEREKNQVKVISNLPKISQQLTSQRKANAVFNLSTRYLILEETSKIRASNVVDSQASNINHTPDWIETEATTMGYIKHPLEQLLAWLDSAMLWLEELLVKIWQQLQKVLISK